MKIEIPITKGTSRSMAVVLTFIGRPIRNLRNTFKALIHVICIHELCSLLWYNP
jgi:hypothetical protein